MAPSVAAVCDNVIRNVDVPHGPTLFNDGDKDVGVVDETKLCPEEEEWVPTIRMAIWAVNPPDGQSA